MRGRQLSCGSVACVAAVLTLSCGQPARSAAAHPPATPRAAAPRTAMERQILGAIDAGDGDLRVRALRQRLAAEPDNIEIRIQLAGLYRDRGYPELALEHCRLAAARFPQSGAAELALARALRDSGLRREAAEGLTAFLRSNPQTSPSYLAWLGILWDELGEWQTGETAHRYALQLDRRSDYLHNNLGYNLLRQGRTKEAEAEFREALALNPHSQVARNNLGLALANTDAKQQAVSFWQSGADPATAHNNLAAYLIDKGQYGEARNELDLALSYNRQHPAALRNLALVSRLDGAPATVALHMPAETRWARLRTSFVRLWVGPLQNQPAPATKGAGAE